ALLKARPVAGDAARGQAFLAAAQERVWHRPFGPDDLRAVRSMKARTERELARKGLSDREVKRGRGGIRDIEFAVQLLQLVHGRPAAPAQARHRPPPPPAARPPDPRPPFFRPLAGGFPDRPPRPPMAGAEDALGGVGLPRRQAPRQSLRELTRGLTRSSRLMQ